MKRTSLLLIITAALLVATPLRAQQEKPKSESAPKSEDAHTPRVVTWYRVDVTINEFENGKKTNTRHYAMHVDDWGDESDTKLGTRIPVPRSAANGDFTYIDVGLRMNARIIGKGSDHVMEMSFDLTSFAIPEQARQTGSGQEPILRQVQTTNWIPVNTSKPMQVAVLDDPNSTKRYEFEASLTKM